MRCGRQKAENELLGSTTKANHPQGWDAKPWVPQGLPGYRMVLVHPEPPAVPPGRQYQVLVSCAVSAATWRGLQASPSCPYLGGRGLPGKWFLSPR